ncbi:MULTISPECIES: YjjG family noncanonical pyrimidine nucleotidase [Myroides]|uniref:Noncanonical pyrimidine nucleotidase, YjjG family n=1 Tax=Myroides albus TaxID=2562892 RepID=A0A6I3LFT7_9FLAO|nr:MULTISPECIES: YjjG family noncanonical pyrimidine nucleotidase [Myroides]MTG97328.1 noncanonical pyrimidine nucleotidase, YjjG family [Myroides albus]MVX34298.1 noncanonical pyrimidine nucleotidase, YjjG family [Myroides sp. LoEW2-1]UVD80585.1 YjjG family noncanonical pyrimidine nucleotidase [Myroides albus]
MNYPFKDKTDIFFDLDHTLWDFERNSALAFEQVIDEMKFPFSIEDFLKFYVDINATYWDKYSLNQVSQEELRIGRIRDTFDQLGYSTTTTKQLEMGDKYLNYLPNYNYLFDGAIDLLDYLQESYRLHIITNGFNEVQNRKLINSGIYDYFQTITNSENAGVKKPDPKIFQYALSQAQVHVGKTVMVGDNLLADIEGARSVGMDAIYYHPQEVVSDKSLVQVQELLQIKNLL